MLKASRSIYVDPRIYIYISPKSWINYTVKCLVPKDVLFIHHHMPFPKFVYSDNSGNRKKVSSLTFPLYFVHPFSLEQIVRFQNLIRKYF